jgi:hypothetical protein
MSIIKAQYEMLLAKFSNATEVIQLLRQYRPYLEMIPSMRRPNQSVLPLPLPTIKLRQAMSMVEGGVQTSVQTQVTCLPCDVAVLMCDPEWKIKTGAEILIYIHRPEEDFSDLLRRWRQTQVLLANDYEWLMPMRYDHMISEGTDAIYPLFVLFTETTERIKRGLKGASLPHIIHHLMLEELELSPTACPPSNIEVD